MKEEGAALLQIDSSEYVPANPFKHIVDFLNGVNMPITHRGVDLVKMFRFGDTSQEAIAYRAQILDAWCKYLFIEESKHPGRRNQAELDEEMDRIAQLVSSELQLSPYDAKNRFEKVAGFINLGYLRSQSFRNELMPVLKTAGSAGGSPEILLDFFSAYIEISTLSTSP